ncbi:RNA-directed DNA polymerase [Desulfobacterales bacterium HSG16]|nr:RNA-directed DNA polymerase [Desulfobacterales bacterium HSG16]
MKRAGNLYYLITSHENLRIAFQKSARGKQEKKEVIQFRKNFDRNIEKLRSQLLKGEPDIGHYHFFVVRDPKVRTVCAASFPERVLHHGIMNVCEPFLDSYSIYDSYACRKGKGNRKALARAQKFVRQSSWYLKLDISKYFNSIDHTIMMQLLARRFKDKDLLMLFQKIIDTHHIRPGKGVPIGNLISQHLANFYLGCMDHWIKEERRIKAYLRYMDDFILFSKEKSILKKELKEIEKYLKNNLDLTLKNDIQLNQCYLGVPFLGFRVFPCHIRLLPRSKKRFSKKLREYERYYCEGIWTERELARHVEPLIDFTRAADSLRFRRMVIKKFGVLS